MIVEVTVIFPHQLFWPNPAVSLDRPVHLLEIPLFFGRDPRSLAPIHRQKGVLHRASILSYAKILREAGFEVTHHSCPREPLGTAEFLASAIPAHVTGVTFIDPVDDWLDQAVQSLEHSRGLTLTRTPSPQFLSPQSFLEAQLPDDRRPLLARFYEAQRKRMQILVEPDGSPVGGKWSFDADNRQRLPRQAAIPSHFAVPITPEAEAAHRQISEEFPNALGRAQANAYPTTHAQALAALDHFIEERLPQFGDYEDAMSTRDGVLFHSLLTPSLNTGLLTPDQVIDRVLARAATHSLPLNSLEGFIRQVIGWREMMRGIYERRGRALRTGNFWNFTRPLPGAFYDGTTGILPVDHVIRQVLDTGYCHHIERLMILGNFLLLCRIHPNAVYQWFMELFIDAYDWVMVPNVYGMSQFADGGTFTTKPYLSGSNYIRKMSDFPTGSWCEIWDALFWTFVADHADVFRKNPRMSMMAATAAKLGPKLDAHRRVADTFLHSLFAR